MRSSPFLILTLLAGCAPGSIAWPTGKDDLRTAMYRVESEGSVQRMRLVLSNGLFTCDLPTEPDPVAQQQALLELQIANVHGGAMERLSAERLRWQARHPCHAAVQELGQVALRPRGTRALDSHRQRQFSDRGPPLGAATGAGLIDQRHDVQLLGDPDQRSDIAHGASADGTGDAEISDGRRGRRTQYRLACHGPAQDRIPDGLGRDAVAVAIDLALE